MFTAKMILLEGFEPQECGARRFLYAGFLTVASNAPEISRLNEAALFIGGTKLPKYLREVVAWRLSKG